VFHRLTAPWLFSILVAISLSFPQAVWPAMGGDFLLFPNIDGIFRPGLAADSGDKATRFDPALDVFATAHWDRFRFLGEYFLSRDEHELERLQFGWLLGDSTVWLGRFHTPLGYWNTQFHHGVYLQTAVTRPAITEFEDGGGPLVMHTAGLLFDGLKEVKDWGLGYSLAIGVGPTLRLEGAEPWNFLSPDTNHGFTSTINLYLQPEAHGTNLFGIFAGFSEIPSERVDVGRVRQALLGFYINWQRDEWRLISEAYVVHHHRNRSPGADDGLFFAGYLQGEYRFKDAWTVFGRVEGTLADDGDPYLQQLDAFVRERILGGISYRLAHNQSVKAEISGNRRQDDDFGQVIFQWSAVFP
jgi:hypothetical protein